MQRLGVGVVSAVALVALACTGSSRSSRAASGEGAGRPVAQPSGNGSGAPVAKAAEAAGATGSAVASEAAPGAGAQRQVEGRVELIDRTNEVTLSGTESAGHAFDKLKLDENTKVTVNGERATIADVNEGDEVRATFSAKGDELHLDSIEVVPSGE